MRCIRQNGADLGAGVTRALNTSLRWACIKAAKTVNRRDAIWAGSDYEPLSKLSNCALGAAGERVCKQTLHMSGHSCVRINQLENHGDYVVRGCVVVEVKTSLTSIGGVWHWNHIRPGHVGVDGVDLLFVIGITPTAHFVWFIPYVEAIASYRSSLKYKATPAGRPMTFRPDRLPEFVTNNGDGTMPAALTRLDRYVNARKGHPPG